MAKKKKRWEQSVFDGGTIHFIRHWIHIQFFISTINTYWNWILCRIFNIVLWIVSLTSVVHCDLFTVCVCAIVAWNQNINWILSISKRIPDKKSDRWMNEINRISKKKCSILDLPLEIHSFIHSFVWMRFKNRVDGVCCLLFALFIQ